MKYLEIINFPAVKIYADGSRVLHMAYTTPDCGRLFEQVRTKSFKNFAEKVRNYCVGYLAVAPHDREVRDLIANAWRTVAPHIIDAAWTGKPLDLYTVVQLRTFKSGTQFIGVHIGQSETNGALVSFYKLEELEGLSLYPVDGPDESGLMDAADKLAETFRGREFLKSLYANFKGFEDEYPEFVPYLRAHGAAAV